MAWDAATEREYWFVLRQDGSKTEGPLPSKAEAWGKATELYEADHLAWLEVRRSAPTGYTIAQVTAWSAERHADVEAVMGEIIGRPIVAGNGRNASVNPHAVTLPMVVALLEKRTGLRGWVVRLDGCRLSIDPPPEPTQ